MGRIAIGLILADGPAGPGKSVMMGDAPPSFSPANATADYAPTTYDRMGAMICGRTI